MLYGFISVCLYVNRHIYIYLLLVFSLVFPSLPSSLLLFGHHPSTTFITCPADPKATLGIKLPFLVMIIKNLKKYFTFEVQVRGVQYYTKNSFTSTFWGWKKTRFSYNFLFFSCGHVQVLDDKNVRRRFRASNYQSNTRVKPFICTMPMRLDDGWNQIQVCFQERERKSERDVR